jgi:autonomous glycyl radical cofactor GrcA
LKRTQPFNVGIGGIVDTGMFMIIMLQVLSDALRHPEKYPQEVREQMAVMVDDVAKAGKVSVLNSLMDDQLNKGG